MIRAITGAAPTTTGAGPYTHTYNESNTVGSFTISENINLTVASVAKLLGCKVDTATISAAIGGLAEVKLSGSYANESHGTSTVTIVAETFDLYSFTNGVLQLPNGATIAQVQSAEITIKQNTEPVLGLGSRFPVDMPVKNREYTGKFTLAFTDPALALQVAYGASGGPAATPAETATLTLYFDNGLSSTSQRQIKLAFTGVQIDEHSLPMSPTDVIKEDANVIMRSLIVTAINNTASAL